MGRGITGDKGGDLMAGWGYSSGKEVRTPFFVASFGSGGEGVVGGCSRGEIKKGRMGDRRSCCAIGLPFGEKGRADSLPGL